MLARLLVLVAIVTKLHEFRFFGVLTIRETALVLGVSTTTVEDDWSVARAWLSRELIALPAFMLIVLLYAAAHYLELTQPLFVIKGLVVCGVFVLEP